MLRTGLGVSVFELVWVFVCFSCCRCSLGSLCVGVFVLSLGGGGRVERGAGGKGNCICSLHDHEGHPLFVGIFVFVQGKRLN